MLAAFALALTGCKPAVAPRETFNWSAQPVAFAPPADGWRREGSDNAGARGVRFVKEGSVGEAIGIGEWRALAERLRVVQLTELLDKFDTYSRREFPRAVSLARSRTDDPISPLEGEVAEGVNGALDRALAAYFGNDADGARKEVAAALAEAERLQFSLDDVLDRVIFTVEGKQEPRRYVLLERREMRVAGQPAVVVDDTVDTGQRVMQCREVYVVSNNHLFIAHFIGLKENLELFDRVVAGIEFPG